MKKIIYLLLVMFLSVTTVYANGNPNANAKTNPNVRVFRFKVSAAALHMKTKKNQTSDYYMTVFVSNESSPSGYWPQQLWTWYVTDEYGTIITVPISGAYITLYANCVNSSLSYSITLPFTMGTTTQSTTHYEAGFSAYSDTLVHSATVTAYYPTAAFGYSIGTSVTAEN